MDNIETSSNGKTVTYSNIIQKRLHCWRQKENLRIKFYKKYMNRI